MGKRTELFKLFPGIWKSLEGFSLERSHLGRLYFGICSQCFWKAEDGVGIFQHDGAAAQSSVEGKLPPSSSLPASGSGFPLFFSIILPLPGPGGSSGGDPNSCTWPWCTERSQARRTTQEYPKSPGISKMSQEELAARVKEVLAEKQPPAFPALGQAWQQSHCLFLFPEVSQGMQAVPGTRQRCGSIPLHPKSSNASQLWGCSVEAPWSHPAPKGDPSLSL